MTTKSDDQSRHRPSGAVSSPRYSLNPYPYPRFSVKMYRENSDSVKQVNEWFLGFHVDQADGLRQQLGEKEISLEGSRQELIEAQLLLAKKEAQLLLANQELAQLKNVSITQFVLGVVSLLFTGFGINLATSNPSNMAAWIFIGSAICIQGISFLMTYSKSRRNN